MNVINLIADTEYNNFIYRLQNKQKEKNTLLLIKACKNNNLKKIKKIITSSNLYTLDIYKPFLIAIEQGNLDIIQYLYYYIFNNITNSTKSPLYNKTLQLAIRYNHIDTINWLHSIHSNCFNLIEYASENGNLEEVKQLYNNGYIPTIKSIIYASTNGHLEVVKYLVSIGCNPIDQENSAIRGASFYGHLSIVRYLHSIGCDPTKNQSIIWSSRNGQLKTTQYLHLIGCDPTINNNSAIEKAYMYDHIETVKYLASIGCDITRIKNYKIRENVINWLNEYKPIFNKCLTEIYGHPQLERTKTENENYFKELELFK